MRESNTIIVATNNAHKVEELNFLFNQYGQFDLIPASKIIRNFDKLKFVETGKNYLENALFKAQKANQASHYACLADDSGLEIQALEGKPGLYSARYSLRKSGETQDSANVDKVLNELKSLPTENRNAKFVAALVIVIEGIQLQAQEELHGKIIDHPRGERGFGYDSVFIPEGKDKTLAEMSFEEKNTLSHRFLAVKSIVKQISDQGIMIAKP